MDSGRERAIRRGDGDGCLRMTSERRERGGLGVSVLLLLLLLLLPLLVLLSKDPNNDDDGVSSGANKEKCCDRIDRFSSIGVNRLCPPLRVGSFLAGPGARKSDA